MAGLAAVGAAVGGTPATAQVAPLGVLTTPAPRTAERAPLLTPIALGGTLERTTRLTTRLRLRVGTMTTGTGPNGRVHQRLASSMVEYFPFADSGFHLSAGGRLYDARAGEQVGNRPLMLSQRPTLGAGGGRIGLRRTPALTFGYTGTILGDTIVGLEAGAMRGRAYEIGGRLTRPTAGDRGGVGNGPINPVVNFTVGRRF